MEPRPVTIALRFMAGEDEEVFSSDSPPRACFTVGGGAAFPTVKPLFCTFPGTLSLGTLSLWFRFPKP